MIKELVQFVSNVSDTVSTDFHSYSISSVAIFHFLNSNMSPGMMLWAQCELKGIPFFLRY